MISRRQFFQRNLNGQVVTTTHSLGTDSYLHNKRGQVISETWFDGHSAQFAYNTNGRLSSMTYPDGSIALYTYDSRSRITAIAWKGQTINMTYDQVGIPMMALAILPKLSIRVLRHWVR